jgi:succinate dehydrogenase hydrophobic anchor subunit
MIFILGFCILLRELHHGYWKNRPSQQLFKVFYFIFYILSLHVSALAGHIQAEYTITFTKTTDPL